MCYNMLLLTGVVIVATPIDDEYKDLISCMMKVIADKYYFKEEDVKSLLKQLSPKHRKAIFSP